MIRDFTTIPNTTSNEIQENITSHNILVVILISHYIKEYAIDKQKVVSESMSISKFHRTISMLVLHLIQCPDLTFEELFNLMSCGKYQIPRLFGRTYFKELHRVVNSDLDIIMDMFKNLENTLLDNGIPKVYSIILINGSSPVGIFLRRIMVFFDKMLFLQTEAVMKEVKKCCNDILNEVYVRIKNIIL